MPTNVKTDRDGNYLRLVAEGAWEAGYKDIDEFLERMGVDPERWEIKKVPINSWPTSGWDKENNQPWTVINHQVEGALLARDPQPLEPQVQPVTIRSRQRKARGGQAHHRLKTALFLSDPHFGFHRDLKTGELTPFHDRRVLDIFVKLAMRLRPDDIIWAGDTLDLPDWSDKFVRSPSFFLCTQPAVIEAAWWLAQLRSASPPSRIVVLEGNHDARLERALNVHLNQVYQLRPADEIELPASMSVPRLLALHKLDIEYVGGYPDADLWLNPGLVATHGAKARSAPGGTVGAEVRESDVTLCHGHIHRREWASRTLHGRCGRRVIESFCPGCACHINGVVPGSHKSNWQQGFAVLRYDDTGRYTITPVAVNDGEAVFEGELYRGEEQLDDLREQTEWEF